MRQGQQNRRGRGRNNNNNNQNRKGQNPLTRSFESTGPDVKLRGTPAHIAEKYIALARDAQSSGDPVLAENYLQHAEHYNRIIMSALAQMPQQQQVRDRSEDDDADEDGEDVLSPPQSEQAQPPRRQDRVDGTGPQPVIEGIPAEVSLAQDEEISRPNPKPRRAAAPVEAPPPAEATASPAGEEQGQEAAPRRARRPRRPRVKAGEELAGAEASGEEGSASAVGDEVVTEAAQ